MGLIKKKAINVSITIREAFSIIKELLKLFTKPQKIETLNIKNIEIIAFSALIIIISILKFVFFFITGQAILKSIISFLLLIITIWSSLLIILLIYRIEKSCLKALSLSIVEVCIRLIQTVIQFLFSHTENYFFYFTMLVIGLIGTIWMCFYVPIKLKSKVFRKIEACFLSLIIFCGINTTTILVMYPKLTDNDFVEIPWDPILSEAANEEKNIIELINNLSEKFPIICEYTSNNITDQQYKNLVIATCDNLLTKKNSIDEKIEKLHFNHTKKIYVKISEIMDLISEINEKTKTILDVDEDLEVKIKGLEEELKVNIDEVKSFEKFIKDNITPGSTQIIITPEFESGLKTYGLSMEKIKNNDMTYFTSKVKTLRGEVEKLKFETEKLKYKVSVVNEVIDLSEDVIQKVKELVSLYQEYNNYFTWHVNILNKFCI